MYVLVDNLLQFLHFYAFFYTTTEVVMSNMQKFVQAYGLLRFISDRGSRFSSHAFEEIWAKQGITHVLTFS